MSQTQPLRHEHNEQMQSKSLSTANSKIGPVQLAPVSSNIISPSSGAGHTGPFLDLHCWRRRGDTMAPRGAWFRSAEVVLGIHKEEEQAEGGPSNQAMPVELHRHGHKHHERDHPHITMPN